MDALERRLLQVLSIAEAKGLRPETAFALFDREGSGEVSPEDFLAGLRNIGLDVGEEEGASLVQRFDTDGNGRVSLSEFVAFSRPREVSTVVPASAAEPEEDLLDAQRALLKTRAELKRYAHIDALLSENDTLVGLAETNYKLTQRLRDRGDELQDAKEAAGRFKLLADTYQTRLRDAGSGSASGASTPPTLNPNSSEPPPVGVVGVGGRPGGKEAREIQRLTASLREAHERLEERDLDALQLESIQAELDAHKTKFADLGRRLRRERVLRSQQAKQSSDDIKKLTEQVRKLLSSLRMEADCRGRSDKLADQWKLKAVGLKERVLDLEGKLAHALATQRKLAAEKKQLVVQLEVTNDVRRDESMRHLGSQSQTKRKVRGLLGKSREMRDDLRANRQATALEREKRVALLSGLRLFMGSVSSRMRDLQFNFADCNVGDAGIAELMHGLRKMCRRLGGLRTAEEMRMAEEAAERERLGNGAASLEASASLMPEDSELGQAIVRNRPVVGVLDLSHNDLTDAGAVLVAKILTEIEVRRVDLRANDIGAAGASALLTAVMRNPGIRCIDLSGNLLSHADLGEIVATRRRQRSGNNSGDGDGDGDGPAPVTPTSRHYKHRSAEAAAVAKLLLHTMSRGDVNSHRRMEGGRPQSADPALGPIKAAEKRRQQQLRASNRRPRSAAVDVSLESLLNTDPTQRARTPKKELERKIRPASASLRRPPKRSARPASASSRLQAPAAVARKLLMDDSALGIYEDDSGDDDDGGGGGGFDFRPLQGAYMPNAYQTVFRSTLTVMKPREAYEELVGLLENGLPVNGRERETGNTMLLHLLQHADADHEKLLRLVLANGGDVNGKNNRGETPLHQAMASHRIDLVRLLAVEHGARLDELDENGSAPLHTGVEARFREGVALLLDLGADPDQGSGDRPTLLHYTAAKGDQQMARLLLEHGASVDATDVNGVCPLAYAETHGHASVADLLRASGAKVAVPVRPAVK